MPYIRASTFGNALTMFEISHLLVLSQPGFLRRQLLSLFGGGDAGKSAERR